MNDFRFLSKFLNIEKIISWKKAQNGILTVYKKYKSFKK